MREQPVCKAELPPLASAENLSHAVSHPQQILKVLELLDQTRCISLTIVSPDSWLYIRSQYHLRSACAHVPPIGLDIVSFNRSGCPLQDAQILRSGPTLLASNLAMMAVMPLNILATKGALSLCD